jgi:PAS domain S-box-containing protein
MIDSLEQKNLWLQSTPAIPRLRRKPAPEPRRLSTDLERQVRIFDTALSAIPDFAYIFDHDGRFLYANQALLDLWGRTLEQAVGKNFLDLEYPDELAMKLQRQIQQVFDTGQGLTDETPYTSPTGAGGYYEYIFKPVFGAAGTVRVVAGSTRDITERKRIEQRREQTLEAERAARAEAERIGRMKDEFLATLSHELRTPLNAIYGWTQLLRQTSPSPEKLAHGLETIERNSRVQIQLIDDLLDMSRIISGTVRLDLQLLELAPVVESAVEAIRPAAEAKDLRIESVLDRQAGRVAGDPARLHQVLFNLLNNSVKFTPPGGWVRVGMARVDARLEIAVSDTGQGIKPEFLPHAFERFRQADSSTTRNHGGLGLGLAIVKQLVELHGGTVEARSSGDGQGATFAVSLPLAAVDLQVEKADRRQLTLPEREPHPGKPLMLTGIKVLLVDDEPDTRDLLQQILEEREAEVLTAASAQEGLDAVTRHQPHVILSDIGMPGQDGYELIRSVRALPDGRGVAPAVALTAFARPEDRERALLSGFQAHLVKPVDSAELVAVVASLAGRTGA